MRVAALYDIHGNLPALTAVLADVRREGVDAVLIGGDVAAGPLPAETIAELRTLGSLARYVRGNADREVVDAWDDGRRTPEDEDDPLGRAVAFVAAGISRADRDFLAGFETAVQLSIDGLGPTLFCHGSPRSDSENLTTATSDARLAEILTGVTEPVIVGGHTHRQFDRRLAGQRIVNAGSVGCPYEGRPGAYWVLLGPEVELRCTDYDLAGALTVLRATGYPDLEEMLSDSLTRPLDPDEVAAIFERAAGA